jgi:diguanylate cyclase (GGDEF)-like protein/PAS domain S-box-containing protein
MMGGVLAFGVNLSLSYSMISFFEHLINPVVIAIIAISSVIGNIKSILIVIFSVFVVSAINSQSFYELSAMDYCSLLTLISLAICNLLSRYFIPSNFLRNSLKSIVFIFPSVVLLIYKDNSIIDVLNFLISYFIVFYVGLSIIQFYIKRYRLKLELDKKEVFLKLYTETVGDAIWQRDPYSLKNKADDKYFTMLGYKPNEFELSPEYWAENLVHPDDKERCMAALKEGIEKLTSIHIDYRIKCKSGDYIWIHSRTASLAVENGITYIVGTHTNINQRKIAEILLKMKSEFMVYANIDITVQDLMTKVLKEAEDLTQSKISFFHSVSEKDETISLQQWSLATKEKYCTVDAFADNTHYPLESAGVWADAVRFRKTVVHNDYATMEGKKGLPKGHAPLTRELVCPIIVNECVVAVMGVGNKSIDYSKQDEEVIESVARIGWEAITFRRIENEIKVTNELLQESQKAALIGNFEYNVLGDHFTISPTLKEMFELPDDYPMNLKGFQLILFEDDRKKVFTHLIEDTFKKGQNFSLQYRIRTFKTNRTLWIYARATPYRDVDIGVTRVIGIAQDITTTKDYEAHMQLFNRLTDQAPVSIIVTDVLGNITYVNNWACSNSGYTRDELIGKNPKIFQSGKTPERTYSDLWNTVNDGKIWTGHIVNKKKDGTSYIEDVSISPIFDKDCIISSFLAIKKDVTLEEEIQIKLEYQVRHDFLTDLYNRQEFESRLTGIVNALQENNNRHMTLAYLDLDQFKLINDTAGHIAGDELLKQIIILLSKNIRSRDVLARLGGDEFGIIFDTNINDAETVCERIRNDVEMWRFIWEDKIYRITISIGLVSIVAGKSNIQLQSEADKACYLAKESGKNKVVVYSDDAESLRRSQEMEVPFIVKRAIEKKFLILFVQPIVSISKRNDNYSHFEVLIRLYDDTKKAFISPALFLPAAEKFHVIEFIDRYVVENVIKALAENAGWEDLIFTVNISGPSASNPKFLDFVLDLMKKNNTNPKQIGFEITESAAIHNYAAAINFLGKLKEMGSKTLLDDFGSGMSSFSYLKNLPIDVIKIDGSFIKNVTQDKFSEIIVRSIHTIASEIGFETVAEFVTDEETVELLESIGITYLQGYHIQKPFPMSLLSWKKSESKELMKESNAFKDDNGFIETGYFKESL